jgi:hypothetical protein
VPRCSKTNGESADLAVVHLAVREYGLVAFRAFIRSYKQYPAGCAHELLIAAKQFDSEEAFAPYRAELEGIPHRLILVRDEGFDLGTYFDIGRETQYASYCFLNSLSEIRAHNWLDKLSRAAKAAPGGLVGASGSWRSTSSDVRYMHFPGLPGFLQKPRGLIGVLSVMRQYPLYPNPHLRTNAFLIERDTMLSIKVPVIRTKIDSSLFESGWNSLTRQVLKRGAKVLVVDADGVTYSISDWGRSGTLWQGEQEGLLVEDRQTKIYRDGDEATRSELRYGAWRTD